MHVLFILALQVLISRGVSKCKLPGTPKKAAILLVEHVPGHVQTGNPPGSFRVTLRFFKPYEIPHLVRPLEDQQLQ